MPDYDYYAFGLSEEVTLAQKAFCLNLLKAAPDVEAHLRDGYFDFEDWSSSDGMVFMGKLLRTCDRLVDQPEGKVILPQIFGYLEAKATELELDELGTRKLSPADQRSIDYLIFTFTDNPTGKDPEFPKLAPFMGPKILKHCTIC